MPRQQKPGLSYFPLDVDFFTDNRIRILRARYGNNGIVVYIYLLCEIYKKGYYMEWNDDIKFILASELNLTDGFIEQVLTFLLERSLLDTRNTEAVSACSKRTSQKDTDRNKRILAFGSR